MSSRNVEDSLAEDSFLDKLCSEQSKIRVSFLTTSGYSFAFTEGIIIEFDTKTIILDVRDATNRIPSKRLLIYKHSIATIMIA